MHRWLESLGGPFIVLATDRLPAWRGAAEDDDEDVSASGYAAACAIHVDLGVIERPGTGEILVLGGGKMATAKITIGDVHGFARWGSAESDEDAARALDALSLASLPPAHIEVAWNVTSSSVSLIDSTYAGTEVPDRVETPLAPGRYNVTAHLVEPDELTALTIVMLRLA